MSTLDEIRKSDKPWPLANDYCSGIIEKAGETEESYWRTCYRNVMALALMYVLQANCYLPAEPTKGSPKIDKMGRIIRPGTDEAVLEETRTLLENPATLKVLIDTAVTKDREDRRLLYNAFCAWESMDVKEQIAIGAATIMKKAGVK